MLVFVLCLGWVPCSVVSDPLVPGFIVSAVWWKSGPGWTLDVVRHDARVLHGVQDWELDEAYLRQG
jgi:hypothetical protein